MPRVNLFVRESDWPAYQAIEDKPQWLHNAILSNGPLKTAQISNIAVNKDGVLVPKEPNKPVIIAKNRSEPVPKRIKQTLAEASEFAGPLFRDAKKGKI